MFIDEPNDDLEKFERFMGSPRLFSFVRNLDIHQESAEHIDVLSLAMLLMQLPLLRSLSLSLDSLPFGPHIDHGTRVLPTLRLQDLE